MNKRTQGTIFYSKYFLVGDRQGTSRGRDRVTHRVSPVSHSDLFIYLRASGSTSRLVTDRRRSQTY